MLMADIEQAEHGSSGRVREWLARAARAPRDPVWMADGVVSEHWAPISPVTGQLDAFTWQAPPDLLPAPHAFVDDVVGDLDEPATAALAGPDREPATTEGEPSAVILEPASSAAVEPAKETEQRPAPDGSGAPEAETPQTPASAASSSAPLVATIDGPVPASPDAADAADKAHEPKPVIFPVPRAPDDPGPDAEETKPRLRLLG